MAKKQEDWFTRLVELIKKDGRPMVEISKLAQCGPNFVQQMIANDKRPSVDNFLAILNVLGSASAIYVLTGFAITDSDLNIINLLHNCSQRRKQAVLTLLRDEGVE